uniref:F-box domain-containing protein n=1 Tax=Rhabditophanes sp. KR3021 TaxID=114890 RepID=A0AC35UBK4_9BILA
MAVQLNNIPYDILIQILGRIEGKEIIRTCKLVSKNWYSVVSRSSFWIKKAEREGIRHLLPPRHLLQIEKYKWDCEKIYILKPFERNLIKNGSGQEDRKHWEFFEGEEVIDTSDSKYWKIAKIQDPIVERPPVGINRSKNIPTCFNAGYLNRQMFQTINFEKIGITQNQLNMLKPSIHVSQYYGCFRGSTLNYKLKIAFRKNGESVASKNFECTLPSSQVSEWKKIEMVCDDYDNDLDSVVFQHGHGFEQMIPDQNRNVRKRECKVARASLIIKYE